MSQKNEKIEKHISSWRVPQSLGEEQAWERLMQAKSRQQPVRKLNRQWVGQLAAGIAALVMIVFALSETRVFAPGETNNSLVSQTLWLPDSSQVQLKAYSSVKYNYQRIGGARLIHLKGEALFNVKEGKRFEVQFPGGSLAVLGTQFAVQAYSEESGRVDCFSGSVKVSLHSQFFTLEKGQAITFDETSVDGPFNIDPEQKLNLPDNSYYWTNRPLKEILQLICQRENYTLEAPAEILNKHFTGQLHLGKPDQAIQILARAMNFNYQLESNKLLIIEKE
jgi:ferric-dicitrate binding protein FerR (iron transport regulator)